MKKTLIVAALLAATLPARAQVYKCVEGGKIGFSDVPCSGSAKGERVRIHDAAPTARDAAAAQDRLNRYREISERERAAVDTEREAEAQQALDRIAYRSRARAAIQSGNVFIGMRAEDAVEAWGRPTKINRDIYESGVKEQWIYDRGDWRAQYIYVENGVVTAIQNR